jgi:tetratricopeptide (TPR) repeat protein
LNPTSSSAYAGRGWVRRRKDQLAEAAADYTEALALNPYDRTSFYERGGVYFEKQEWKEARDDFGKTSTLYGAPSDHSPFYAWIASARLGQRNDGSQSLMKYVRKLKKERLTTPTPGIAEKLGPHPLTQWEPPKFARSEKRTERSDDDRRWAIAIGEFLTDKLSEQQFFAADPSPSHFAGGPRGLRPPSVQSYDAWFFAGEKALLKKDTTKAADYFNKCRHAYGGPSSDWRLARAELKLLGQWSEEDKPK